MPLMASALSGSASKNAPMSFAIETRCSMFTRLRRSGVRRLAALQKRKLMLGELVEALLPGRRLIDLDDLDCRHFVLRAIGRPVRVLGRDDVRARFGEVERRVD